MHNGSTVPEGTLNAKGAAMLGFASDCLSGLLLVLGGIALTLTGACPLFGDILVMTACLKLTFNMITWAASTEGGLIQLE